MRGSMALVAASSSIASATLSAVGTESSSSRHRSISVASMPGEVGGRRQAVELVGRAERRVVARVSKRFADDIGVERSRPRVSLALVDDDANADTLDLRGRERLDVAFERVHVDVA